MAVNRDLLKPYLFITKPYTDSMNAYRLITKTDGASSFQKGQIKELKQVPADYFFFQQDPPERKSFDWHPAPRAQYVITLRGTIEFTVTDGTSFVLQPGDILIAQDMGSTGHKWRMIGDESWARTYIVLKEGEDDGFEIEA